MPRAQHQDIMMATKKGGSRETCHHLFLPKLRAERPSPTRAGFVPENGTRRERGGW